MKTLTNRILSVLLILCALILPISQVLSIDVSARSVLDLEGTDLNGATVLTDDNKYLSTKSYVTDHDEGYVVNSHQRGYALSKNGKGTPFVNFFVDTLGEDGEVIKGAEQYNGYDCYGFVAGTGEPFYVKNQETGEDVLAGHNYVAIKLQYNFDSLEDLQGTDGKKYSISDDTWMKSINGISSVGVVEKGAIIVQKFVPSDDKPAPTENDDWKRVNYFSGETTDGLHTVNFFEEFSPSEHQDPFNVYVPSGEDLSETNGIYIKITVAYELVNTERTGWWIFGSDKKTYKDVVEETVLYLCNTSGEIVFENLYFSNGSDNEATDSETETSVEQKEGPISNNQGSQDGFRVNYFGWDYDVTYHFNDCVNPLPCKDGQVFVDVGKYEFVIRTDTGLVRRKTVYIHEKGIDRNVDIYFGDGLVSSDSVRLFMPNEQYPVYLQGTVTLQTKNEDTSLIKHAPLVGRVYLLDNDWSSVERDEMGLPLSKLISEKTGDEKDWSLTDLPAGMYEAVFVNNEEYFNGTATGDTYKFVWRFSVYEEGQSPFVNMQLLYQQVGFSDYESVHYITRLQTKGTGDVLVVFRDEISAYDFACKYLVSTVEVSEDGKYTFDKAVYDEEEKMLVQLRIKAHSMVEKRYFDATNVNTYLTLGEDAVYPYLGENPSEEEQKAYDEFVGVLDREINVDVLVFISESGYEDTAIGEPFLNNRIHAYIDENGEIKAEENPVRFITVQDNESESVTLYLENTDISYSIPYGIEVQSFLENKNAPSGRYKIVESNVFGTTEYYAIYIRSGENSSSVTLERVLNNNSTTHTLTLADAGLHLSANNVIITKVFNDLDAYGIIKIRKEGGETSVYQINEYENIPPIDEEGIYEIILVDRLGNTMSFFIDIFTAKKVYNFTLKDGDDIIFTSSAYSGKKFTLEELESKEKNLKFGGWIDENGTVHRNVYTFNSPKDVVLTAVWQNVSVDISVFDGDKIANYIGIVGKLQTLPEIKKTGYNLYGFRYVDEEGVTTFYRGQITSIPNVSKMRLDAVWVKEKQVSSYESGNENSVKVSLIDGGLFATLDMQKNSIINLPSVENENNMTFMGWLYDYRLSGVMFTNKISYDEVMAVGMEDENAIPLTAAYLSPSTGKSGVLPLSSALQNGSANTSGQVTSAKEVNKNIVISSLFALSFAIFAIAFALKDKILKTIKNLALRLKIRAVTNTKCAKSVKIGIEYGSSIEGNTGNCSRSNSRIKKILLSCMSLFLCVVMFFMSGYEAIVYAVDEISASVEENNERNEAEEAMVERNRQINIALSFVEDSFIDGDDPLLESKEFLYSNIIVDLLSMGYSDVFTAYALVGSATPETDDDRVIEGIGYTAYVDAYEVNGENIFGAGFVSLISEDVLTKEEVEKGVIIQVSEEEADSYEYTEFKLTANQTWGPLHYVAYDKYVHYQVYDYTVQYTISENDGNYIDEYGDVYSYDLEEYTHFTNYGETFELDAYGISSDLDYDELLQMFREIMGAQLQSGVEVEVEKADYISGQALRDYKAHYQDESFLGIDDDTLLYYEAHISDTQYYVIYDDGTVAPLELPPDPANQASIWERILVGLGSALLTVAGIVCCVLPGAGPIIGGGLIGGAMDLFVQSVIEGKTLEQVNWWSVGTSFVTGMLTAGVGSVATSVAKNAAKTVVGKFFAQLSAEVVSGLFSGAITYLGSAAITGEFTIEDMLKSMALGAATGAVIFVGGQAISALSKNLSENALKNFTKFAQTGGVVIGGALSGLVSYALAIAITGQEFSVEGLLLSMGMGAAVGALAVIGNKLVKTAKSAQLKRQAKTEKPTEYNHYKKIEDGVTNYYDDNGNLYRSDNDLAPNSEYDINGYKYKTDSEGRIVSVEGELYLKNDKRSPIKDSMKKIGKGQQLSTDHRGHLIGDRFNGGNGLENIVPQDGRLNQGAYKSLEDQWANALQSGKKVTVNIEVTYDSTSLRPNGFSVEYSIDGVYEHKIFKN